MFFYHFSFSEFFTDILWLFLEIFFFVIRLAIFIRLVLFLFDKFKK